MVIRGGMISRYCTQNVRPLDVDLGQVEKNLDNCRANSIHKLGSATTIAICLLGQGSKSSIKLMRMAVETYPLTSWCLVLGAIVNIKGGCCLIGGIPGTNREKFDW